MAHLDTAVALAQGMYESRDFSAMPILADALQDAGCDSDDILTTAATRSRSTSAAAGSSIWCSGKPDGTLTQEVNHVRNCNPACAALTPPPVSVGPCPWRWTREQYYKLGELGFFDGKRVELIRGEIIEMSPINWPHAQGVGLVSDALARVFATGFWLNVQQPIAIPGSAPGSAPQPDVAVIPGSRRSFTDHPTHAALLVEVADTTLFSDTTTKAELYATAGVPEYWVLDIVNRQLHVFRDPAPLPLPTGLGAIAYRTHQTFGPADPVSPMAAPGATVMVSDLLP